MGRSSVGTRRRFGFCIIIKAEEVHCGTWSSPIQFHEERFWAISIQKHPAIFTMSSVYQAFAKSDISLQCRWSQTWRPPVLRHDGAAEASPPSPSVAAASSAASCPGNAAGRTIVMQPCPRTAGPLSCTVSCRLLTPPGWLCSVIHGRLLWRIENWF